MPKETCSRLVINIVNVYLVIDQNVCHLLLLAESWIILLLLILLFNIVLNRKFLKWILQNVGNHGSL